MDPHRERRRFWRRVTLQSNGCWKWIGGTRSNGYGSFAVRVAGSWTQTTAHRWSYASLVGAIPDGYEVDHLCRNRACVRPDHLEAVSVAENRRRRDIKYSPAVPRDARPLPVVPDLPAPPPRRDPAVECRNGHAYAEVGWVKNGARRTCAGCMAARVAAKRKGGAHGTETHCPRGHEYTPENIYRKPSEPTSRQCRICIRERTARLAAAKRAAR